VPVITKQTANNRKQHSKTGGILNRLRPIQDFEEEGVKICIYGKSGTGKTKAWSSFPKPILAALCSGAGETRTIKNVKDITGEYLRDEAELAELVQHQRETGKYKTIVLDHTTSYQDLMFKKVVGTDAPAQLAWGSATQEQWGLISLGVKERLRDMLSLACNVVLISQEREYNTDQSVSDIIKPYVNMAMSPSITGWIGPNVDYLVQAYLRMATVTTTKQVGTKTIEKEVEQVQYCLRTGPSPVYATKFRLAGGSDRLPECLVLKQADSAYEKIVALING